MGNCVRKNVYLDPGAVLDRVISQASNEDDCVLYKLANYKKGGELIEAYAIGGMVEVEKLIREQFGILMYRDGDGQIISRTEYLRWKFRNVKQVVIPVEATSATDPLGKWVDHEACWQMQYRGSLGETLLHLLIICDTRLHTRLARILIKCFPKLAVDVFEGEEYLGASALHLAIAYTNNEIVHQLVESGARIEQRAIGSFFLPRDQQKVPPSKTSDYEGLAYFGEYPLAWAACVGNESVYNLLLDKNANPDWQDSFGNMILHMVVVTNQLGMYGYALRHPKVVASNGILNHQGLTPLTLACRLGRASVFREMLELSSIEFWRYSNHTCSAYPLNALDTISPDGKTNWNSALFMILAGSKEEHLNMLDGGIIQRLLEEKWKTFAQRQFLKRISIAFLHIFALSFAIYLRPADRLKSLSDYNEVMDMFRLAFEILTIASCVSYVVFQQGEEIKNQGFSSFLKQLPQSPPKALFLLANFTILACIPLRILGDLESEEVLLSFSMVGSWFFMMFFAGAVRLTGPFITMIFSMITGDMLTFGIIYLIFLLAFSQAFHYLYKAHPSIHELLFQDYPKTWMAMYQMTLGQWSYSELSSTAYPNLSKGVFIMFMILVPILLLNMLIAMMGNTYAQVIERSEREYIKQWAKLVVSLERAISQDLARQYIQEYSIKLPSAGEPAELRGVMVIKTKNKTKAKQRKGAVSNWKRVGKVTINALKKRGMTGEEMRLLMWGHRASVCTPQGSTPRQRSIEITDPLLGMSHELGQVGTGQDPSILSKLNTTVPDGTIRQSDGSIGSSVNPFGCFDDSITIGLPSPGSSFPIPPIGDKTSTTAILSSLPSGKPGRKQLNQKKETPKTHSPEPPNNNIIVVADQITKVKRRNITQGLRPKILIFSDKKDLIRVHLDSDESESEMLCMPQPRSKSSRRLSIAGSGCLAMSSSPEALCADSDEDEVCGTVNPAFIPDDDIKVEEAYLVQEPIHIPEISITNERMASNEKSEKRPKSAKHRDSNHGDESHRKILEKEGTQNRNLDITNLNKEMNEEKQNMPSTEKKKKRRDRSSSAKNSERSSNSKLKRPQTAFVQNSTGDIANMNEIVAWDRPEDDI